MDLKGKVAIVTGAARGLGHAYACSLAEAGAAVIAADLRDCSGTVAAVESAGGKAVAVPVDVAACSSNTGGPSPSTA